MSSNTDDYDDLDEFLEDPSKLDEEQANTAAETSKNAATMSTNNPETASTIEDLQSEFAKLLQDGDDSEENKKTVENFKQLLNVLGEAGSGDSTNTTGNSQAADVHASNGVPSTNTNGKDAGFKDIVSNTLDRLKENSTKVDSNLMEEKKKGNSDDILSQLLGQLVEGDADDEEGVENAIKSMLNQMSAKEVLYHPMKEMHVEYTQWMDANSELEEHADKMPVYRQQFELVGRIVTIYECDDYEDNKYRDEVGQLLDELEQLGESPVSKGFGSADSADLNKLLEVDGDEDMGNIDKELQDTCKQQ
ncbi:LAQU0S01e02630g1_1 [Lachancea quebecensis]|uniref:LAQU0S01e02630g1_1 n=1 Tax=Lachancea quebecensis TaxID=1654605 RepID=A0A0P1KLR5_9SACH|nr:LAQU0S01e02630g1_1 [Lachancea quebecensis]